MDTFPVAQLFYYLEMTPYNNIHPLKSYSSQTRFKFYLLHDQLNTIGFSPYSELLHYFIEILISHRITLLD